MGLAAFKPPFATAVADGGLRPACLTDDFTAALLPNLRYFPPGAAVLHEGGTGPYCLWILQGWLALDKGLSDGKVQIIDLCLPQDMVFPLLADDRTPSHAAHAVTELGVCSFSRAEWFKLADRMPGIAARAAAVQSVMRARWVERMLRLGRGTAAARIAYLLLELHLRQNTAADNGESVIILPTPSVRTVVACPTFESIP